MNSHLLQEEGGRNGRELENSLLLVGGKLTENILTNYTVKLKNWRVQTYLQIQVPYPWNACENAPHAVYMRYM